MSAAQAIRRSAIEGGYGLLQKHELDLIDVFAVGSDDTVPWLCDPVIHWGNYMLLVAEELSPTLPVEAIKRAAYTFEWLASRALTVYTGDRWLERAVALRDLVKGE